MPKNEDPLQLAQVTDNIRRRIMQSPKKSTRKLSQQAHVSRTMCQCVLESLDLKPYRVTVVQQLQEADGVK